MGGERRRGGGGGEERGGAGRGKESGAATRGTSGGDLEEWEVVKWADDKRERAKKAEAIADQRRRAAVVEEVRAAAARRLESAAKATLFSAGVACPEGGASVCRRPLVARF